MDIFGILTMIGGLALFLFGMNFMSQGLQKAAGWALICQKHPAVSWSIFWKS